MQEESSRKRYSLFWIYVFALALIKYTLTTNLSIYAIPVAQADDGLMFKLGSSIRAGQWLGAYDNYTLVKGPVFAIFLAFVNLLGVSFLEAETWLYTIACVFFTCACGKIHEFRWKAFVLYTLLLYCPVSYALYTFQRVYRNGIVLAEVLFVFGAIIAVYLNQEVHILQLLFWEVIGGMAFAALMYTRDDSIWIVPFVIVSTLVIIGCQIKGKNRMGLSRVVIGILISLFPFFCLEGVKNLISLVNYEHYGIYCVTDTRDTYFSKTVQLMYSITDDVNIDNVSVSRNKINRLCNISPTLNSISEELSRVLDVYEGFGIQPGDGEVEDGWFYWALRDSVNASGHYSSAQESEVFYKQIYEEIKDAVERGELSTHVVMPSALMSPWRQEYYSQLCSAFSRANTSVFQWRTLRLQEAGWKVSIVLMKC